MPSGTLVIIILVTIGICKLYLDLKSNKQFQEDIKEIKRWME